MLCSIPILTNIFKFYVFFFFVKTNKSSKSSSKSYCIHSINIKLFRISIDFKNIKLAKQVTEELQAVHNSNETEKKLLLEKLVDKFGLYVPLEFIVGGRINYSLASKLKTNITPSAFFI